MNIPYSMRDWSKRGVSIWRRRLVAVGLLALYTLLIYEWAW